MHKFWVLSLSAIAICQVWNILADFVVHLRYCEPTDCVDPSTFAQLVLMAFPIAALIAIWRYTGDDQGGDRTSASDACCFRIHHSTLVSVYTYYCLFFMIFGVFVLLLRNRVFTLPDNDTIEILFGTVNGVLIGWDVTTVNIISVILEFVGMGFGYVVRGKLLEHRVDYRGFA